MVVELRNKLMKNETKEYLLFLVVSICVNTSLPYSWKRLEKHDWGDNLRSKLLSHNKINIFTSPFIVLLLFFFKHVISQGTNVSGGWYSGNLSSQIIGFTSRKRWIAYNLLSQNKDSFHWSLLKSNSIASAPSMIDTQ